MKVFGGSGETQSFGDGDEIAQVTELHVQRASLSYSQKLSPIRIRAKFSAFV
jgi:hypothetical protein